MDWTLMRKWGAALQTAPISSTSCSPTTSRRSCSASPNAHERGSGSMSRPGPHRERGPRHEGDPAERGRDRDWLRVVPRVAPGSGTRRPLADSGAQELLAPNWHGPPISQTNRVRIESDEPHRSPLSVVGRELMWASRTKRMWDRIAGALACPALLASSYASPRVVQRREGVHCRGCKATWSVDRGGSLRDEFGERQEVSGIACCPCCSDLHSTLLAGELRLSCSVCVGSLERRVRQWR